MTNRYHAPSALLATQARIRAEELSALWVKCFDDLDGKGLRLATRAAQFGDDEGRPPAVPADPLYRLLLARPGGTVRRRDSMARVAAVRSSRASCVRAPARSAHRSGAHAPGTACARPGGGTTRPTGGVDRADRIQARPRSPSSGRSQCREPLLNPGERDQV